MKHYVKTLSGYVATKAVRPFSTSTGIRFDAGNPCFASRIPGTDRVKLLEFVTGSWDLGTCNARDVE